MGNTSRVLAQRVGRSNNYVRLAVDARGTEWQALADCASTDPEVFFLEGPAAANVLRICHGCPVVDDCLEFAVARPELTGIWAATTQSQRTKIRRRRGVVSP